MSKKTKQYNPYLYQYENVLYPYGEVKVYFKEKSTRRMHVLYKRLEERFHQFNQELQNVNTEDDFFALFYKYKPLNDEMHAEICADFLIANNIAHRNKPLHISTAIKQIEKKHKSLHMMLCIYDIRDCIITDLSFSPKSEHNLAYFLYIKYGVLLLNQHTYNHITEQISKCTPTEVRKKELNHYRSLQKMFYIADRPDNTK